MRLQIGGAIVDGNFDLPRILNVSFRDPGSEWSFPRYLEEPIDLGCSACRVVNLRLYRLDF